MKVGPSSGTSDLTGGLGLGSGAGGDLDGTLPDPTVVGIGGIPVDVSDPDDGDILTYVAANADLELLPPPAGVTDHGALTGLADDDHSAYETVISGGGPTVQDHGSMGAAETISAASGNQHRGVLDADCTITVSAFADGGIVLKVEQDGTGGWAITWSGVTFASGADDQPAQGAGEVTWFTIISDDGVRYGFRAGSAGGSAIEVLDEGSSLTAAPASLDFVGAGVTASVVGDAVTVTIPGAGGAVGPILITDTPAGSPLVFADLLQTEDGDDLLYADV